MPSARPFAFLVFLVAALAIVMVDRPLSPDARAPKHRLRPRP